MNIFYKSVGHGGVLLLNSTPDTTGLIPLGDMVLYKDFGDEINRRFDKPLKSIKNKKGTSFEISLDKTSEINHIVMMEDYKQGHRIREYVIEGLDGGEWKLLASGSAVGRMKIDHFPSVRISKIRVNITKNVNLPLIRSISIFDVENYQYKPAAFTSNEWSTCGKWDTKDFVNGSDMQTIDLTTFMRKPGQYEVAFTASVVITGMKVNKAEVYFDNDLLTQQDFITQGATANTFYINRTAQVAEGSTTILKVEMISDNKVFQNKGEIKIRERVFESAP
jgi:alpha-L-fucosidase